MYHQLVRGRLRTTFEVHLTNGDYEQVLAGLAPDVHHRFAGDHPLGGERYDREGVRLWFERLSRLFPRLAFTVTSVSSGGWPWDIRAAVEWVAEVTPHVGPGYRNVGAHVLRIRNGKVTELHAYEDSQAVASACALMAAAGVEEASAPPITKVRGG